LFTLFVCFFLLFRFIKICIFLFFSFSSLTCLNMFKHVEHVISKDEKFAYFLILKLLNSWFGELIISNWVLNSFSMVNFFSFVDCWNRESWKIVEIEIWWFVHFELSFEFVFDGKFFFVLSFVEPRSGEDVFLFLCGAAKRRGCIIFYVEPRSGEDVIFFLFILIYFDVLNLFLMGNFCRFMFWICFLLEIFVFFFKKKFLEFQRV